MSINAYKQKVSIQNLGLILRDSKMLLGRKMDKIGKGLLVAPGGKVEVGEGMEESVVREIKEESGLTVKNIKRVAKIIIQNDPNREDVIEIHVFLAEDSEGGLVETEKVKGWQWYPVNKLPLKEMFPIDELWVPLVLQGRRVEAEFTLDHPPTAENPAKIIHYSVKQFDENWKEIKEATAPWKIK